MLETLDYLNINVCCLDLLCFLLLSKTGKSIYLLGLSRGRLGHNQHSECI